MKIPSISNLVRLALLRGLMRLGSFVLRRTVAARMQPAVATARHAPAAGHIIDGEFRRIDPRHNNSW